MSAALLVPAMLLDAALGEPKWLWNRWPHPAVLMGRLIGAADRRFNTGRARRAKGVAVMAVLGVGALILGAGIAAIPDFGMLEVVAAAILLAQRSLVDHVRAVGDALRRSLPEGRHAVSMIVGRDTEPLDEPGVVRAALESAAENLSDGIIAPAFWFLILGLPGLILYKVTNTADSMIGHLTERHSEFGWAAARFDDLLNLVPARLTAVLICVAAWRFDTDTILADAPLHRSPNAGWPEAAFATALGVALSGPRSYHGEISPFPWVNGAGRRRLVADDIDDGCRLLWRSWGVMLALVTLIALI